MQMHESQAASLEAAYFRNGLIDENLKLCHQQMSVNMHNVHLSEFLDSLQECIAPMA